MTDFWKTSRSILITGASSGLGRCLALELAKNGHKLFLTGRNTAELESLSNECRILSKTEVDFVSIDLASPEATERLFEETQKRRWIFDALVNNAGFGLSGVFENTELRTELELIQVNIVAVLELTKMALRRWFQDRPGAILNIGSTGAFQPGPLTSVYYASKAFLRSWSLAISHEVRKKGIRVTTVYPGALKTSFSRRSGKQDQAAASSPHTVARKIVRAWSNGKLQYTPGYFNAAVVFLSKILPARLLAAIVERIQKSVQITE